MVAQQILVLLVKVRILVGQPKENIDTQRGGPQSAAECFYNHHLFKVPSERFFNGIEA